MNGSWPLIVDGTGLDGMPTTVKSEQEDVGRSLEGWLSDFMERGIEHCFRLWRGAAAHGVCMECRLGSREDDSGC